MATVDKNFKIKNGLIVGDSTNLVNYTSASPSDPFVGQLWISGSSLYAWSSASTWVLIGDGNTGGGGGSASGTQFNIPSTLIARSASGSFQIGAVDFHTASPVSTAVGRITWDDGSSTALLGLKGGNINLPIGQQEDALVYNGTGSALARGQVVRIVGAQGQRPRIDLAAAISDANSSKTFGIVAEPILNAAEGFVTTFGIVSNINTAAFTEGASLWLSPSAGGIVSTMPIQPYHNVFLGYCLKSHASAGRIFVKIQNGYEIEELHDVLVQTASNNQILSYNSASSLWMNKDLQAAIKEVDGANSGIDADLLDGQQGSYYLDWTNTTNKPDPIIGVNLTGNTTAAASVTLTDLTNGQISLTTNTNFATSASSINWIGVTNKPDPIIGINLTGNTTGAASATLTDLTNGQISITTNTAFASTASSINWAGVTGRPTTLSGYGITDAIPVSSSVQYLTKDSASTLYINRNGDSVTGKFNIYYESQDPFAALAVTKYSASSYTDLQVTEQAAFVDIFDPINNKQNSFYITKNGGNLSITQGSFYFYGDFEFGTANVTGLISPSANFALHANTASSINWSRVTGTPTTLLGYGITDGLRSSDAASAYIRVTSSAAIVSGYIPTSASQEYLTRSDAVIIYAPLASASLTGIPVAPTASRNTNTPQIATTAFVLGQANSASSLISMDGIPSGGVSALYARADHAHPSDISRAPIASASLTGVPIAPTASPTTNTQQIATTQFVRTEITNLIASAPATLDTLNELAAALGNDPNFATSTASAIGQRLLASTASTLYMSIGSTANHARTASSISISGVTNLQSTLDSKAAINSPTFTGTPILPTFKLDNSSTSAGLGIWNGAAFYGGIGTDQWARGSGTSTNIAIKADTGRSINFFTNGSNERMVIDSAGNIGIGISATSYKLEVNGSFAATTKSFDIEHPTKENMRLRYGSLEGPENGVYVRGRSNFSVINLPDYWTGLVDEDSITVQLTSIGKKQDLFVEDISDNTVKIGGIEGEYFYLILAERKDVDKLVVEYGNNI